jgi:hypothetical protein
VAGKCFVDSEVLSRLRRDVERKRDNGRAYLVSLLCWLDSQADKGAELKFPGSGV